jgi:hypothetical protein
LTVQSAPGAFMMARRDRVDMIERSEAADMIEPIEVTEPIENADSADPMEPIDRIEPTEPIDRIEPLPPMHRIEFSDRIDHSDRDGDTTPPSWPVATARPTDLRGLGARRAAMCQYVH